MGSKGDDGQERFAALTAIAQRWQTAIRQRERGSALAFALGLLDGSLGQGIYRMIIRIALAAAIAAPCVGCASVTRGTTENISISSTPAGATAEVTGLDIPTACVTPCVVQAKRNADITVTVSKEGYEPQVIPLTKEVPGTGAAGFAGNLLLGGLVGMGVDAATGAALDHKPNPVIVTLQPAATPRAAKPRPPRRPPSPQS